MLMAFVMSPVAEAQKNDIFVNPDTGNDQNTGSQEQPVKTLFEAARRVNQSNGSGAVTIYLSEGIYGLDSHCDFSSCKLAFFKRSTVDYQGSCLPDDADWNPGKMPVIVSTMPLDFKPNGRRIRLEGPHTESRLKQVMLQFRV